MQGSVNRLRVIEPSSKLEQFESVRKTECLETRHEDDLKKKKKKNVTGRYLKTM